MLMEYSQKSLFIGDSGNFCNCNDENVETKLPLKWKKEIVLPNGVCLGRKSGPKFGTDWDEHSELDGK